MATNGITILGGGISGITTALTLQLLGYETTLYAEHLVREETPDDPRFSSLYPAASVIPHSVSSGQMETLFDTSQQVFMYLRNCNMEGIQLHRHYELFEFPKEDPPYADQLINFNHIAENGNISPQIPCRPGASSLWGWEFDCLVTEWPIYIHKLYRWYNKQGGSIVESRIEEKDIPELKSDIVINCTGIWSRELFSDEVPARVVRGHLLKIPGAPLIKNSDNLIPSYNYTPQKEIYADPEGNPTDIYFYPRSNGWVLGGSRQKGIVEQDGSWNGNENKETVVIDGQKVPRQIYDLNKEVIGNTFDHNLDDFDGIITECGYRYVRKFNEEGLRLDSTEEHGKIIFHNYGHGGAGVTLSWGCAIDIAKRIAGISASFTDKITNPDSPLSGLQDEINRLVSGTEKN